MKMEKDGTSSVLSFISSAGLRRKVDLWEALSINLMSKPI
jgi:hypothetical protein